MPEPAVTINGEILGVQTQGDLAVAFLEMGDAIRADPDAFLGLAERHGDGFAKLSAAFGITDPTALATAAVLARSGAPETLVDEALTQARSAVDRLVGGTAVSLVDLAVAVRSIPELRWEDVRRTLEAIHADPSSLAEAMVEPFRERIAAGDYAGALGYGLPEVMSGVAALGRLRRRAEGLSAPIRITRGMLDENGAFKGQRNAGPNAPLFTNWLDRGRGVELMPEGHFRYSSDVRIDGRPRTIMVDYPSGYPDFRPFLDHPSGVRSVEVASTGRRSDDNRLANAAVGHPEWGDRSPRGWTWHHDQDGRTMQLVPRAIHQRYGHRGGIAQAQGRQP